MLFFTTLFGKYWGMQVQSLGGACRVNAVAPGGTETQPVVQYAADAGMTVDDLVKAQANHLILQRQAFSTL